MKQAVVIGGGIIGLSSAFYLQQSGWKVTVLDKLDFLNNCSYGNAGYVCPSHFIPLATPGIVQQGFKWMLNPRSPFYVQPRLNRALWNWGWKFIKSARAEKVDAAAIPLRDIALLSQVEYEQWASRPDLKFSYEHKGLLEIFQTRQKADHAHHTVEKAHELGLEAELLDFQGLSALEPQTRIQALGAIYFKCDAHLYPNLLMEVLIRYLKAHGVNLVPFAEVKKFSGSRGKVQEIVSESGEFAADEVILAAGSWTREIAALLDTRIPLVAGRGYSVTLENPQKSLIHPAVLMEGRVAITPMDGNKLRFGGTMEITSLNAPPRYQRVEGILDSVSRYFPELKTALPPKEKIWYGFRPCSADGLPYIGRIKKFSNVVVATGHSMLGLSLGAGTGKLVSELINDIKPSMDITPFAVERFA